MQARDNVIGNLVNRYPFPAVEFTACKFDPCLVVAKWAMFLAVMASIGLVAMRLPPAMLRLAMSRYGASSRCDTHG